MITGPRRWCRVLGAILLGLLSIGLVPAGQVLAHAYLDRSNPEANEVVEDAPERVEMWFTEPLEPRYSSAVLYDAAGEQIETEPSSVLSDPFRMNLPLPRDLPNGTYTVQWRNISAADGHPQTGFFPFTIGTREDVVIPRPPPEDAAGAGILGPLGRWLSLLGVTGAVGAIFTWLWVLRPATTSLPDERRARTRDAIRRLANVSLLIAIAGSVVALTAQTITVTGSLGPSQMVDTVVDTRYGTLWAVRILHFMLLGFILSFPATWRTGTPRRTAWLAMGLALATLLPYSMISHAAAQSVGAPAAIVNDWLHLAAASVWVGGLIALLLGVLTATRGVERELSRPVLADLIPRFSTLAIASVTVLILTGLYASWLLVGNLQALRETDYGRMLGLKLLLTLPLLGLGLLNLTVIGPWMRRSARAGKHFTRTLAAEVGLGIAVLGVVALLISLPPARDSLQSAAERAAFRFDESDLRAVLYISPGVVGENVYTVDVTAQNAAPPPDTQVLLRVMRQDDIEGVREVELSPVPAGDGGSTARFEASGSELSVVGEWDLELIVRRPQAVDWRAGTRIEIGELPIADGTPGPPPRFAGLQASGGFVGLAAAILLGTVAARRRLATEQARLLGWIAVFLLLFAGLTMWQTKVTYTPGAGQRNPIAVTAESVATGRDLYVQHCATCHGDDGRGDGLLAGQLQRPPADLTAPHVSIHPDGDLAYWIQNGIPPAMPGFSDELSDVEVWHLVNYIRSLRDPVASFYDADLAGDGH
jgi:copper transport protein